ncbi:MAG: hypothetical protein ACTILK_00565 [Bifidobacterium crudilactis]|uniref:hypothetical protein n=1 Tax=Bifidobacterium crudilactis TaxID=327277 RepID=UPI003F9B60FC
MKMIYIITAKVNSQNWFLIRDGKKHYEIRDHPFNGAKFIHYVDSATGLNLGTFELGATYRLYRDDFNLGDTPRNFALALSGITREEFNSIFPTTTKVFFVARILQQVDDLDDLFYGEPEQ